jgi:DNA invertase Pin-like site-specific DNA recombinase
MRAHDHEMGVFAEFERSMIRERVLAGKSRAAASGTRSGKPIGRPRIGAETEASIRAALQKGDIGMRKVAVQFGVATGTVQRIAKGLAASVAA